MTARVSAGGVGGAASTGAAVAERLAAWDADSVADRLWARDGSLWADSGHDAASVAAWLGWLDLPTRSGERIGELRRLAREVRADGYTRAAVLGMGGSSLAPELFGRLFGDSATRAGAGAGDGADAWAEGHGLELRILDSTHPDAVRGFRSWAESARTLFCVSSKSGTTTEPLAFHAAMAAVAPALDFVAITDPGSSLADLARAQEFRAIVDGPPDVGGRYSALSPFGLVPAAMAGVDLDGLLRSAAAMAEDCRRPATGNPGLQLGAATGEAALAGRDKLTILSGPRLSGLGDWIEQLVAESTGKQGRGVIPVVGEPLGAPDAYGADRFFVHLSVSGEPDDDVAALAEALAADGHPVTSLELGSAIDIGAEFVRWEVATAAIGIVLGVDPFDQPNVQESKDATRDLLAGFRESGVLPAPMPIVAEPGLAAWVEPETLGDTPVSVDGALSTLLGLLGDGDYLALLAYVPPDPPLIAGLQRVRAAVRDALGVATTLGIGPRYLHSTGQLHKGGPGSGVFVQLTADPHRDLPIPGWQESFGTLIAAQALGDLAALQRRERRVLRMHAADAAEAVARLERAVSAALGAH